MMFNFRPFFVHLGLNAGPLAPRDLVQGIAALVSQFERGGEDFNRLELDGQFKVVRRLQESGRLGSAALHAMSTRSQLIESEFVREEIHQSTRQAFQELSQRQPDIRERVESQVSWDSEEHPLVTNLMEFLEQELAMEARAAELRDELNRRGDQMTLIAELEREVAQNDARLELLRNYNFEERQRHLDEATRETRELESRTGEIQARLNEVRNRVKMLREDLKKREGITEELRAAGASLTDKMTRLQRETEELTVRRDRERSETEGLANRREEEVRALNAERERLEQDERAFQEDERRHKETIESLGRQVEETRALETLVQRYQRGDLANSIRSAMAELPPDRIDQMTAPGPLSGNGR